MTTQRAIARFLVPFILPVMLAACGSGNDAAKSAQPSVIKERQDNFEGMGDAFKIIRGQLESGAPDFAVIASNAETITTNAGRIKGFFPQGTGVDSGADTEALASIWAKPDEFAAAADKLVAASQALQSVAAEKNAAGVQNAVKELGGTCKGCHDVFRLDKK